MPCTRFVKSPEEIARLQEAFATPAFLDIRSLAITFESDPEVIAELIPPPLRPAADPTVSISISEIRRSDCVGPFNGCSVNLACTYEGEPGFYCLTMPMSTDTAVIFGRELYAEPKKLAAIELLRDGRHVRGTVTRHGITYIELTGSFEEEMVPLGRESRSSHYYFKYLPAADGRGLAFDPQLIRVTHRGIAHRAARGSGTITFRESTHDPIIDLPVLSAGAAGFSEVETHTRGEVVTTVLAADFLPYAFGKMDNLAAWAEAAALATA
ncbi:MAG: acetoacetate decarboxylase family protein [Tepidiformaceae bacterium]